MGTVVVCTVGGSHQPVVAAVRATHPDYVYFVCTDRDAATGAPGSRRYVEGQGTVIKQHPADEEASLPNIPTQCGLNAEQYETVIVDGDDLDAIFQRVDRLLGHLTGRQGDRVIADYTGGTKSMTAGLVLAALEHRGVELQLVTGARDSLRQVSPGTEKPFGAEPARLRLERALRHAVSAWQRYAYAETVHMVNGMEVPVASAGLRALLVRAHGISDAFAAWDRFDHASAHQALEPYRGLLARHGFVAYFNTLNAISRDDEAGEMTRLLDLWRNAERRAHQARYDDAIARCYRLLEGVAQWLLRVDAGISTDAVPPDALPPDWSLPVDDSGYCQIGLLNGWRLAAYWIGGDVAAFHNAEEGRIRDLLNRRNQSILAHGWQPIGGTDWQAWRRWIDDKLVPLMLEQGKRFGVTQRTPQLPATYPAPLLDTGETEQVS